MAGFLRGPAAVIEAYLGAARALSLTSRSRSGVRTFQIGQLRALVRHAYARVPYYRRLLDRAGVAPEDIHTLDDLRRIPSSGKSDLRDLPEADAFARGVNKRRILIFHTSGSTGAPMIVRSTVFETRVLQALRMQAMMRLGLRPTDKRSFVLMREPSRPSLAERVGLFRSQRTDALQPAERILADLRAWRPDVIRGYPSALSSVADLLTDADRAVLRPRFITTDSEELTPHARRQIERGFRVPVYDVYDCYECNVIATQCPRTSAYHVMDAAVIVEVLKDGRPAAAGEVGEVVLTALHSWAAPLIRYRIGDLVEQGSEWCTCGAPRSSIARVQGRVHDELALADGRRIHPQLFASHVYRLTPSVRRYQVVQDAFDHVVVKLEPVAPAPPTGSELDVLQQMMARDLGDGIRVQIELVSEIRPEPNGKFSTFRCLVPRSPRKPAGGFAPEETPSACPPAVGWP